VSGSQIGYRATMRKRLQIAYFETVVVGKFWVSAEMHRLSSELALNFLDAFGVLDVAWVPYFRAIFDLWSDVGLVGEDKRLEIPRFEHFENLKGFEKSDFGDLINVLREGQFIID
jgi:hypothetical protein